MRSLPLFSPLCQHEHTKTPTRTKQGPETCTSSSRRPRHDRRHRSLGARPQHGQRRPLAPWQLLWRRPRRSRVAWAGPRSTGYSPNATKHDTPTAASRRHGADRWVAPARGGAQPSATYAAEVVTHGGQGEEEGRRWRYGLVAFVARGWHRCTAAGVARASG